MAGERAAKGDGIRNDETRKSKMKRKRMTITKMKQREARKMITVAVQVLLVCV